MGFIGADILQMGNLRIVCTDVHAGDIVDESPSFEFTLPWKKWIDFKHSVKKCTNCKNPLTFHEKVICFDGHKRYKKKGRVRYECAACAMERM